MSIELDTDDVGIRETARENQCAFAAGAAGFKNLFRRERFYRCVKQKHFALPDSAETGFGRNPSNYLAIFRQQSLGALRDGIAELSVVPKEELVSRARDLGAPLELVKEIAASKKLPVVLFCAGGVSTPADAALMMELGAEGIFVGSGIFKSTDPAAFARAIVDATTHWQDASVVLKAHISIPEAAKAMDGLDIRQLADHQLMASRGN